MDVSISKEFIKVYDQLQKLQNDITDVAKECYSTPVVSYDEIENTPQNLSDFENDQNFVTEEQVDDKISNISIDDSQYLKKSGEESQKCEVPTDFEVLSTRTQEEDDSSDNVATTQFVHNLVNKSSGDAVQQMIGVCASKKYVTDEQMNKAIVKQVNLIEGEFDDAIREINNTIDNIEVPTKTSELINDSGFITIKDIPEDEDFPVTSVNGQTGDVHIDIPTVPTNISSFNNDAGYITDPGVVSVNGRTGVVLVQENVQSDWNSTSGLSKILNKPTLKAVATSGDYNDLDNLPSIVQSDWDASDGSLAEILNKPIALDIEELDGILI